MKAVWNGQVIAESEKTVEVEGNHYFPKDSLVSEYFEPSTTRTTCAWKGVASYYNIRVSDQVNQDAAWTYETPSDAARNIRGHVAFWKGVQVQG